MTVLQKRATAYSLSSLLVLCAMYSSGIQDFSMPVTFLWLAIGLQGLAFSPRVIALEGLVTLLVAVLGTHWTGGWLLYATVLILFLPGLIIASFSSALKYVLEDL